MGLSRGLLQSIASALARRTRFLWLESLPVNKGVAGLSLLRKLRLNPSHPLWVCVSVTFASFHRLIPFIVTEAPPGERPLLFIKKLHQCRVLFDFNDASSELKGKQIKAQTLHEMLEYITTQRGVITESLYPEVVSMVSVDHSIF